jgi:hypothetical protein
MMAAVAGDVHPPLWYMIEWGLSRLFDQSEIVLRLPSLLFSSLSPLVAYQIVKQIGKGGAGLAGALMMVMPSQIYYGQEARMYALLILLVLTAARAVQSHRWLLLTAALGLMLYLHNMAALYAGVLGLWALAVNPRRAIRAGGLALAAWVPWWGSLAHQLRDINNGFWVAPTGNLGGALYWLSFATTYTRLPEWLQAHAVLFSFGVTIAALWLLRFHLKAVSPLLLLSFGPPALLYGVSALWRPMMLERALLPSGSALLCLWGMGLSKIAPALRKPALAFGLPFLALALGSYWLNADTKRYDLRQFAEIITPRWQTGDVIYHMNLASYIALDYYMPDLPQALLPQANDLSQSLTEETKRAMGITDDQIAPGSLDDLGYRRVWLVFVQTPHISTAETEAARQIMSAFPVLARWRMLDQPLARADLYLLRVSQWSYWPASSPVTMVQYRQSWRYGPGIYPPDMTMLPASPANMTIGFHVP